MRTEAGEDRVQPGLAPDLVVAVDWSAASQPRPRKPSPDACWLAWAFHGEPRGRRPPPEYFRTRASCEARLRDLLHAHPGSALVGLDFPLGYPLARDGSLVLPVGRDLCRFLAGRISDDDSNRNNRFEVAAELNRALAARFGESHGPFWGCPANRSYEDDALLPRKRVMAAAPEYRAVERHVRETRRLAIQSPWKLYTTGSVGGQALLGLPAVHRLLDALGDRARLWPFESIENTQDHASDHLVVLTEIWPTLHDAAAVDHPINDARQVVATRDALLDGDPLARDLPAIARREGWIAGLQPRIRGTEEHRDAR
jgi:hypothetical protein